MAFCFELDASQQRGFLRYVAHRLALQTAAGHDGRSFSLTTSGVDELPLRSLGVGKHAWVHEGQPFTVELGEEGAPCGDPPSYFRRMRVWGDDGDALQAFLIEALRFHPPPPPGLIWTYAANRYGHWRETGFVRAQTFDDLFLPERDVRGLQEDVRRFLDAEDRYARAGRAHKLCLLFAGPPGSGKSSLVRALALAHNRDLYSLSLSGLRDADCNELVSSVRPGSLLLIEDFDSLGFSLAPDRKRGRDEERVHVTRSGFLNLLDGNGAPPKGTIVCLTANCTSGFDEALVRAGRVDRVVAFASPQESEVLAALRRLTDDDGRSGRSSEDRHAAFCAKAKKLQRSLCMASVTDHLLRHPADYLETFEELGHRCAAKDALIKEEANDMFA